MCVNPTLQTRDKSLYVGFDSEDHTPPIIINGKELLAIALPIINANIINLKIDFILVK
jgi:hypothetical protein